VIAHLAVGGATDRGLQRDLNEDRFYFKVVQSSDEAPLALLMVADGMGGQLAGEVASEWAVQTLRRELSVLFRPQDPSMTRRLDAEDLAAVGSGSTVKLQETDMARLLLHAIERANQVLLGYAHRYPEEAGDLGTTLTLAVVEGDRATLAHVGDSRAYLWHDGVLRQLTEDHSVPGALLRQGKIAPEEVHDHPHRNLLYRCLGLKPGIEVDVLPGIALQPGDRLLLCSDGVWDMVQTPERLASLAGAAGRPADLCRRMIEAANQAGGEDNSTALLACLEGSDA
jgi:protein phosphatase